MSLRRTAALSAIALSLMLSACGSKETEVKKPDEPALPEPKTGAAIDAAAEEAMQAAEKATDAEAEVGKGKEESGNAVPVKATEAKSDKADDKKAVEKKTEEKKTEDKKVEGKKAEEKKAE
jgi:hypothetical protein